MRISAVPPLALPPSDADYVEAIVAEPGKVNFWELAIKPCRPMAFGTLGDALFFGLPGNFRTH